MSEERRRLGEVLKRVLPEAAKPVRRLTLSERLIWTALVLVVYEAMSSTALYGVTVSPTQASPLLLNIIFASSIGTLTTLGIGPIVTGGLILQLLVGAEILRLDLKKSEDRALFTALSKIFTLVIAIFQAAAYIFAGYFGTLTPNAQLLVFAQLLLATIVIMLMDEMVQKGWGLGSGISLFIAAGVAGQIFSDLFSPIVLQDGYFHGIILAIIQGLTSPEGIGPLFIRHVAQRGDILGLLSTIAIILLLIYVEGVRVNIPISHSRYGGFRGTYPIKLLYVSNVPVIFASTIFTNIYYLSSIVWSRYNPDNSNQLLNLIGTFTLQEGATQPVPTGGLAYYALGPSTFTDASSDPIRAVAFVGLMVGFCLMLGRFWITVGGLAPERVADQLIAAGMQVPGFRRSPVIISSILRRYIYTVAILGSIIVGLLASLANYVNAFGTGTGLLLMVSILYQYYQILMRERIAETYPALARLVGEE
ncbi:MAG: preprotein translocase subunit SecY [Nitrososphaerota archaeon]|nr:preprotein translocase subunit SecY [Candidatus Calditenuaceae archaeon]MDW8072883.1 preprotein translocase subunit SecY [Nitrososphaerota archaeon]